MRAARGLRPCHNTAAHHTLSLVAEKGSHRHRFGSALLLFMTLNHEYLQRHIPKDHFKTSLHVSTHLSENKPGSSKQAEQLQPLKYSFLKKKKKKGGVMNVRLLWWIRTCDDLHMSGKTISVRDVAIDI